METAVEKSWLFSRDIASAIVPLSFQFVFMVLLLFKMR
jgi:hypothetical protein